MVRSHRRRRSFGRNYVTLLESHGGRFFVVLLGSNFEGLIRDRVSAAHTRNSVAVMSSVNDAHSAALGHTRMVTARAPPARVENSRTAGTNRISKSTGVAGCIYTNTNVGVCVSAGCVWGKRRCDGTRCALTAGPVFPHAARKQVCWRVQPGILT